jgi:hypothetical protein
MDDLPAGALAVVALLTLPPEGRGWAGPTRLAGLSLATNSGTNRCSGSSRWVVWSPRWTPC